MNPQQYYGGQFNTGNTVLSGGSKPKSRRQLLIIVAAVLVVLTIVAGIFSAMRADPADKLMETMMAGNVDASYELLGPKARESFGKTSWNAEVGVLSSLYTDFMPDTKKTTKTEDITTTTYRYTLTPKDPKLTGSAWTIVKLSDEGGNGMEITDYQFHSIK